MYRCTVCDSEDVEEKMWVNMNTLKLGKDPITNCDLDEKLEHFCNNCEDNVIIYNDDEEHELTVKRLGSRLSAIINRDGDEVTDGEVIDQIVEYLKSKDIYNEKTN
jgi:hypothetical protein